MVPVYLDMNVFWDSKSDMLLARIVGLLNDGGLREHSAAVRAYKNGTWLKTKSFPVAVVTKIDHALHCGLVLHIFQL